MTDTGNPVLSTPTPDGTARWFGIQRLEPLVGTKLVNILAPNVLARVRVVSPHPPLTLESVVAQDDVGDMPRPVRDPQTGEGGSVVHDLRADAAVAEGVAVDGRATGALGEHVPGDAAGRHRHWVGSQEGRQQRHQDH